MSGRLTVEGNLAMGAYIGRDRVEAKAEPKRIRGLFPRLAERALELRVRGRVMERDTIALDGPTQRLPTGPAVRHAYPGE